MSVEPATPPDPPPAAPAAGERGQFVPVDLKTVFLGGLFVLALLAACYAAAGIVLPIVVAFLLMLAMQPAMRLLIALHFPRGVAALVLILVFFGAFAGLGTLLSGPAADWAQKLPSGIPKLQERLSFLSQPIAALQRLIVFTQSFAPTNGSAALPVTVEGSGLSHWLLDGTRSVVGGLFETAVVLFFLLISGDTFLRRLVEILPRFRNKRQAVEIAHQIENDVAVYLATITIMNAFVGIATGVVVTVCGVGDPVLWATVAFLLNYVPILGPAAGVVVFLLVGLLSVDALWLAFLPAGLYLTIHLIEGEVVTPLLLARHFAVNPVLIIISLVFWYWMWGVPGAILATPMLAMVKIVCDRIDSLVPFGHFIEA